MPGHPQGGKGWVRGVQATTEEIGTCGEAGINGVTGQFGDLGAGGGRCHSGAWGWLGQCWWEPWGRGVLSLGGVRGGSALLLGAV